MRAPHVSDRALGWLAALLVVLAVMVPVGALAWLSVSLVDWLPSPWGRLASWALLIVIATCYVRWMLGQPRKRKSDTS